MTRDEHEDTNAVAVAAMIGILSRGEQLPASEIASRAFDISEAFQKEKLNRIGERPPYDM